MQFTSLLFLVTTSLTSFAAADQPSTNVLGFPLTEDQPKVYRYILKREKRKDQAAVGQLIADGKTIMWPGSDENLFESKSADLGMFELIIATHPNNGQPFWDSHRDILTAWDDISDGHDDTVEDAAVLPNAAEGIAPFLPKRRSGLERRADGPVTKAVIEDETDRDEMRAISWPPGVEKKDLPNKFYHDDSDGEGTYVYIVDSGAELDHPELKSVRVVDWLYAGPAPIDNGDKSDWDFEVDHGSRVLAKVAGATLGSARKANVVLAQAFNKHIRRGAYSDINALLLCFDHIKAHRGNDKVVLNISWSFKNRNDKPDLDRAHKEILTDIFQGFSGLNNVMTVVSSGNDKGTQVDRYPALLGKTIPRMIVVGGVDPDGKNIYQTADFVKVSGVATDLKLPKRYGSYVYDAGGTSFSAPTVAGLIAYIMRLGHSPDSARDRLYNLAKPHSDNGPPMLWNGIDFRTLNAPRTRPSPAILLAPPLDQECLDLGTNKYITRDNAKTIIETKFCPDAVKQGGLDKNSASISRTYEAKTLEEVEIAIDWAPGLDFKPNMNDCVRFLRDMVLDGCNGNDPKNNPKNWKAGGSILVDGKINYRINPKAVRPLTLGCVGSVC